MTKIYQCVTGLACFVFMVTLGFSLSLTEAQAAQNKVLRVAMADDYAPFYFKTQNGYSGISYEVATYLFDQLGYTLVNQQYETMAEVLTQIQDGEADIVVNLTQTPTRQKLAYFTNQAHIYETQDLIARTDNPMHYQGNINQLVNYRIGVIFGWTYGPEFDDADFINKAYTTSPRKQLVELLAGEYDLAINNKASFLQQAGKLKLSQAFRVLEPSIYALPVKIAVSRQYKNGQNLIRALNQQLDTFLQSEKYRQLRLKYQFSPLIQQEPAQ